MNKLVVKAQNDQIFSLQIQGDKYARLLVGEKKRYKLLQEEWEKLNNELILIRQKRNLGDQRGGGVNAVKSCLANEQRVIQKLENRLAACKTRESKILAQNDELKQRVDQLRANRLLSQSIFEKNKKRLMEMQEEMHETFRISTNLVAERDQSIAQASMICEMQGKELEQFDQIYEKLAKIIAIEKENAAQFRKASIQMDPDDEDDNDYIRGNLSMTAENDMKNQLETLKYLLNDEKGHIQHIDETLDVYENTFNKLCKMVNVEHHNKLVEAFSKGEEDNFALYRYIQNLNNEITQIEEQKERTEIECKKYAEELQDGNANVRKRLMEALEETKNRLINENNMYEKQKLEALKEFQPIARAVDKLYISLGCNEIPQQPLSSNNVNNINNNNTINLVSGKGNSNLKSSNSMSHAHSMNDLLAAHGVTEGNILQILAIIEQRSNQLIQQFTKISNMNNSNSTDQINTILGSHIKPSDPNLSAQLVQSLLPEYPLTVLNDLSQFQDEENQSHSITTNGSDEEDFDMKPLSREELQKRAIKNINSLQINQKLILKNKNIWNKKRK